MSSSTSNLLRISGTMPRVLATPCWHLQRLNGLTLHLLRGNRRAAATAVVVLVPAQLVDRELDEEHRTKERLRDAKIIGWVVTMVCGDNWYDKATAVAPHVSSRHVPTM